MLHQSSVIVEAVVRRGMTPEAPIAMEGDTTPDQ
jgi:hypothetical protein